MTSAKYRIGSKCLLSNDAALCTGQGGERTSRAGSTVATLLARWPPAAASARSEYLLATLAGDRRGSALSNFRSAALKSIDRFDLVQSQARSK